MPLFDILACKQEDVETIITSEDMYSNGVWFQAKRIAMVEHAKLGEIIGVGSYDELSSSFNLVGEPLEEGPWPQTYPVQLSEKLANISEFEMVEVCEAWAKIEEFDNMANPSDLIQYLKNLQEFLVQNQNLDNRIFLVNSL